MTVPTMRPDHHRPTASQLVFGFVFGLIVLLALSGAAAAAGSVDVDLGALDALPPMPATEPGTVRLRPPNAAKAAPAERPAPAAKPPAKSTTKSTARIVPAPAPETTVAAPATPATPPRPQAAVKPPPAAEPAPIPPLAAIPPPPESPAATPAAPTTAPTGRILFTGGSFDLSADGKAELDGVAKRLNSDPHLYLQVIAYAAGGGDGSEARRMSLSRALAARSYLLDRGVDGKQVDVRPLGNKTEPGLPPDRVDCVITTR